MECRKELPYILATIGLLVLLRFCTPPTTNTAELYNSIFLGRKALEQGSLYVDYELSPVAQTPPTNSTKAASYKPVESALGNIFSYTIFRLENLAGLDNYTIFSWLRLLCIFIGSLAIKWILKSNRNEEFESSTSSLQMLYIFPASALFVILSYRVCPFSTSAIQWAIVPWLLAFLPLENISSRILIALLSALWANFHFSAIILWFLLIAATLYVFLEKAFNLRPFSRVFLSNLLIAVVAQCLHPRLGLQNLDLIAMTTSPLLSKYPELSKLIGVGSPDFRQFPELAAIVPIYFIATYFLSTPVTAEFALLSCVGITSILISSLAPALGISSTASLIAMLSKNRSDKSTSQSPLFLKKAVLLIATLALSLFYVYTTYKSSINTKINNAPLHLIAEKPIGVFSTLSEETIQALGEETPNAQPSNTLLHLHFSSEANLKGIKPCLLLNSPSTILREGNNYITGSAYGDYRALLRLEDNWKEVLTHWNIQKAILPQDSPLFTVLTQVESWVKTAKGKSLTEYSKGILKTTQAISLRRNEATSNHPSAKQENTHH